MAADDVELPAGPQQVAPVHPGELLAEILQDHLKLSVAEAAARMGVTRQALYAVLNGSVAVSASMAYKFGKLVEADPRLYLAMQAERDLWFAEHPATAA